MKDMEMELPDLELQQMEGIKIIDKYRHYLSHSNLVNIKNTTDLMIISKDLALLELKNIIKLNVTKDYEMVNYWEDVKEFVDKL